MLVMEWQVVCHGGGVAWCGWDGASWQAFIRLHQGWATSQPGRVPPACKVMSHAPPSTSRHPAPPSIAATGACLQCWTQAAGPAAGAHLQVKFLMALYLPFSSQSWLPKVTMKGTLASCSSSRGQVPAGH